MISIILVAKDRNGELNIFLEKVKRFGINCLYEILVVAPDTGIINIPPDIDINVKVVPIKTEFHRLNFAHARNVGARYAKYNWLVFLDVDLFVESERTFQSIIETISNAGPNDVFGAVRFQLSTGVQERTPLPGYCQIMHKSMFKKVNGYNETFIGYGGEDGDMARRLGDAGANIQMILDSVFLHKSHPAGKLSWSRLDGGSPTILPNGEFKMSGENGKHVVDVQEYRRVAEEAKALYKETSEALEAKGLEVETMRRRFNEIVEKERLLEQSLHQKYNEGIAAGVVQGKQETKKLVDESIERFQKLKSDFESLLQSHNDKEARVAELAKELEKLKEPIETILRPWYKRLYDYFFK